MLDRESYPDPQQQGKSYTAVEDEVSVLTATSFQKANSPSPKIRQMCINH